MNIFLSGASGNIGREIVKFINPDNKDIKYFAGTSSVRKVGKNAQIEWVKFDFLNPAIAREYLSQTEVFFLLRPPNLSKVKKIFFPLLQNLRDYGITKIVFLSVQGAGDNRFIPHHKIENHIVDIGFEYVFLRPGYFMQNLTTAFLREICNHNRISVPSGNGLFNWVDALDIGEVAHQVLTHFDTYKNQAIDLTGSEQLDFEQACNELSTVLDREIHYRNMNPFSFYFEKRNQGLNYGLALVMTLLHTLPRIQSPPELSGAIEQITGHPPQTLHEFLSRERKQFSLQST